MSTVYLAVPEAKRTGLIPHAFHAYFKDTCRYCGSAMVISESCTILKCGNPHCIRRVGSQAAALLKDLGYKGFGPETLTSYCYALGINCITEFLRRPIQAISVVDDLNRMCLTFPKLVEMMHFPNIGSKAQKVFGGFDSVEQMFDSLGGAEKVVSYVCGKMGGYDSAYQVIDFMYDYMEDLVSLTELVTVVPQTCRPVLVEITGCITNIKSDSGSPLTKDQYINALNQVARKCNIEFVRSGKFTQLQFMIADTPSNTRKYNIGKQYGILITSDTLWRTVEELVKQEA